MPLFLVEATIEAVVEADTREAAVKLANEQQREIIEGDGHLEFFSNSQPLWRGDDGYIRPWLPDGWDEDTFPYGRDREPQLTIGEIVGPVESEDTENQ